MNLIADIISWANFGPIDYRKWRNVDVSAIVLATNGMPRAINLCPCGWKVCLGCGYLEGFGNYHTQLSRSVSHACIA